MSTKQHSKRLSFVLRHAPEEVGLELRVGGWVQIDELLAGFAAKGWPLTLSELKHVVNTNDKKRFTISEDGTCIRAAQGHSIDARIDHSVKIPPITLYHGTAVRSVKSILEVGLKPMSRQHVHLSQNVETAKKVGARHSTPKILVIRSYEMWKDGFEFYQSDNGVWLTKSVATKYISVDQTG